MKKSIAKLPTTLATTASTFRGLYHIELVSQALDLRMDILGLNDLALLAVSDRVEQAHGPDESLRNHVDRMGT